MAEVGGKAKAVGFRLSVDIPDDKDTLEGADDPEDLVEDASKPHLEAAKEKHTPGEASDLTTSGRNSKEHQVEPVSPSLQRKPVLKRLSTCSLNSVQECLKDSIQKEVDGHGSVKSVKLVAKSKNQVRERLNYARMSIHLSKKKIHVENNANTLNRTLSHMNRKECGVVEDDEQSSSSEDEEKQFHCGYLLDAVKRRGYRDKRHPERGGSKRKLLKELKSMDEGLYEYCKDAIKRDELLSCLVEDVTEYYKNADAVKFTNNGVAASNIWAHTTTKAIKEQVQKIIEHKRQVKCFASEVRQFLLTWTIRNAYVSNKEELLQKKSRLDEFYKQYRDYRNAFDMPFQHPTKPTKPTTPGTFKHSRAMCFDAESQWDVISVLDKTSSRPCTSTSTRPGTSSRPGTGFNTSMGSGFNMSPGSSNRNGSVKYGLKWNIDDQKMKWEAIGPCEGTRAFNMLKQSTPNLDLRPSTGGLKTSFFPSIGSDTSGSLLRRGSGSLQTSTSAPSLGIAQGKPSTREAEVPKSPTKNIKMKLPPLQRDLPVNDLPTEKYLETCKRCMIMPTPLAFVTGHSRKIDVASLNLLDSDLRALTSIMKDVDAIDEIDLADNLLLTEKVLLPFFGRLHGEPASSTLQKLNLSKLKNMGTRSFDALTRLLSDDEGLTQLRSLNIGGTSIPPKSHIDLATAIRDHSHLEQLNLADTGMGLNSWVAMQCVEKITASTTLKNLDLGWNCFDVDDFTCLGKCLVKSPHISSLYLSNCSSAAIDPHGRPPPITFFLEFLAYDTSLTYLDLSLNRMELKAALILEDSLEKHRRLGWLEVSNNSLGVIGIRCLLRLLAGKASALTYLECKGCYDGGTISPEESFNGVDPAGNYNLDLSRPYHRSILRMLYKTSEKFQLPPEQAFCKLKFSRGLWTHPQRNTAGTFELPHDGKLTFLFSIKSLFEHGLNHIDEQNYGKFMDDHMMRVKTMPAFHKLTPIFATWKLLDGHEKDQYVFLNAIAKDFMLTPACVEQLCTSCSIMRGETLFRLFPSVIGGESSEAMCMLMFKTVGQFLKYHSKLQVFIDFNVENPTGHYKLDLDNPTHYALAEKLLLLDHWETVLDKRYGRVDISNWNNGSHFRNEKYKDVNFRIVDWMLPDCEEVEFDYVSRKRMPKDAAVMSDLAFNNVLCSLYDSECSSESQLAVMQMTSHLLTITSMHLRRLLGTFKDVDQRARAFVIFFLRVADMWNSKTFRVAFDDPQIIHQLRTCLGDVLFFPFIQPENYRFELDFSQYDHRLCVTILLMLAGKESLGNGNLRDYHFIDANGVEDPMALGVPNSWVKLKEVPPGGIFTCTYMCAPENRKFKERLKLANHYAAFNMEVEENQVQWSTGLNEVDDDVLLLLEHMVAHFSNTEEAFTLIDGPGGNGVITYQEFKEGLKEMKFERFKKPRKDGKIADEDKRIKDLFRYLDPGGEGSVSKEEFAIFEQLWYEYQLCIYEFVHFLQRTFGEDLMISWGFLEACAKEARSRNGTEGSRNRRFRSKEKHAHLLALHGGKSSDPVDAVNEKLRVPEATMQRPDSAKSVKSEVGNDTLLRPESAKQRPDSAKSGKSDAGSAKQRPDSARSPGLAKPRRESAESGKTKLLAPESSKQRPDSAKSGTSDKSSNYSSEGGEELVELTCEEFVTACEDIGYFGPAKCVFGLLDHSGDGNISRDEFDILEKYKT